MKLYRTQKHKKGEEEAQIEEGGGRKGNISREQEGREGIGGRRECILFQIM